MWLGVEGTAYIQRLAVAYVELDYLHWEPNWVEVPNDVMRDRVSQLSDVRKGVDGNYSTLSDAISRI